MRRAKRTIIILGLALASCRAPTIAPVATPAAVEVRLMATTATLPLLEDFLAEYRAVQLRLYGPAIGSNWAGIEQRLRAGMTHYAFTEYVAPDSGLWVAPIGQDGIAIIVHPGNPVPSLTLNEVRSLLQGVVTSWAALGGPDLPVVVVVRERGAGTRQAVDDQVMGVRRVTPDARLALSSQGVVDTVASTPGAIGYVSMAYLGQEVRAVPLAQDADRDAVQLTAATVSDGTYPLRTPLYIVGRAEPDPDSVYYAWFAWMQSDAGQQIVARHHSPLVRP